MEITQLIIMAASSIGGGAVVAIFNKLKMDKKDAADVSQNLINSLFDQHKQLLEQVQKMNSETTSLKEKLLHYERKVMEYESKVAELQQTIDSSERENLKLRKLVSDLQSHINKLENKQK